MYIKNIVINNIRSIAALEWSVCEEQTTGWHVFLGNNGSGKSTLVRSVALALVGPAKAIALRQPWQNWLRLQETKGEIRLNLSYDENFDTIYSSFANPSIPPHVSPPADPWDEHNEAVERLSDRIYKFPSATILFRRTTEEMKRSIPTSPLGWESGGGKYDPFNTIWGENKGWFSASFGPHRRFTGGDDEYATTLWADEQLSRHLTAFDEKLVLSKSLLWLRALQFRKLEGKPDGATLDLVQEFINQPRFLPFDVRLNRITSDGVEFVDGNGCQIEVDELSDGYRSILSLTLELVRQLAVAYGAEKLFNGDRTQIIVPGVVLIDEVDAHLHPTWQQEIGAWFLRLFPKIQFLVTTHSPLVCHQATTVFLLSDPGTEEKGRFLKEVELDRLRYGNVLEAYSTGAFGDIERSKEGEQKLERLAELNQKELRNGLTKREKAEQNELRSIFATTPHAAVLNCLLLDDPNTRRSNPRSNSVEIAKVPEGDR